ncbi:MAG TPA: MoaD/ThiS family protein [Methylomirabilota bacterium]|nr:MoaD/ThiS family protein [Methylomirabilota bacterium]
MKIEVRLFANLAAYLPPGARRDAATVEVPDAATVADVARWLQIPDDLPRLVLVNGRDATADQPLVPGDVVTLYPPLAGG